MKQRTDGLRRFCIAAVLALAFALLAALALSDLMLTAKLGATQRGGEDVVFVSDAALVNLAATAAVIAFLLAAKRLIGRAGIGLLAGAAAVYALASGAFLISAGTQQMYDFAYILEAAQLFAQGNYKPMTIDYFNVCSYQLGICLPMEMALRVLPGLDLNLFMQGLGVALNMAIAAGIAWLAAEIFEHAKIGGTVMLLMLLFAPMFLYPIYAYSTLPMLFCVVASMLCFVRYIKTRRIVFGALYAVLMAVGYMLKPNAAIAMLAMLICAVLEALDSRDWRLPALALVSVALGLALARGVIWQYELRSGVTLGEDVGALARLVMGLQDGGPQAGWYNRYIERFFPFEVTALEERAIAAADLRARLAQMAAQPAATFDFFARKLLSQWLEPACGTMWYGNLCEQTGPTAAWAQSVFAQGGAVRAAFEAYANVFRQAAFLLACAGLCRMLRESKTALRLMLPLYLFGGAAYHMLFEAKSQYMYVYLLVMLPLSAYGLCALEERIAGRNGRKK